MPALVTARFLVPGLPAWPQVPRTPASRRRPAWRARGCSVRLLTPARPCHQGVWLPAGL